MNMPNAKTFEAATKELKGAIITTTLFSLIGLILIVTL